jgi:cbb3-type cytochrome oxidase subunit 3
MLSLLIAVLAILFIGILVHRHRLRERKHERQTLRRIADNYLELHKRL